tara:strand:+ start:1201 stop:1431 length:231 start_codon:yes stop_codon:yes gene_type:complete
LLNVSIAARNCYNLLTQKWAFIRREMKLTNKQIDDYLKGWDRGKNRAKNIKLANGKKTNIKGYLMINNLKLKGGSK